uniref:Putative LOV domain-containing protein n=1 Tax=Pyramimonas parkeae TaxID=36894 RepID=A0A126X1Z1_9CHLO|nr:putative LOV domain-containing protein [Pyramimonas parkeae]
MSTPSKMDPTAEPVPLPACLQKVLELSPYSMVAADVRHPKQPLVYVNDRFLEQTKYARSEILGTNCRFLQGADTDHETVVNIAKSVQGGHDYLGRILNFTKDGDKMWNYLLLQPLRNDEGVCTHFTALQIFVPFDNKQLIGESAKELSLVAEYVETKVGNKMSSVMRISEEHETLNDFCPAGRPSLTKPDAPSRASFETAHRPGRRRASILPSPTRHKLDTLLMMQNTMLVVVNVQQGDALPIVYASVPMLEETWMQEEEVLGSNLTLLLGKPQNAEETAMLDDLAEAAQSGREVHQNRWLRTRHNMLNMIWGHFALSPVSLPDGVGKYAIGTFIADKPRDEPLLSATPARDTVETLREWLVAHKDDNSHIRPSLDIQQSPFAAAAAQSSLFGPSPAIRTTGAPTAVAASSSLFGAAPKKPQAQHEANVKEDDKEGFVKKRSPSFREFTVDLEESDSDTETDVKPAAVPDKDRRESEDQFGEVNTEGVGGADNRPTRLSSLRKRREAHHFTLLPYKTQWIDLVLQTMQQENAPKWGMSMGCIQALKMNLDKYGKGLIDD